MRLKTAVRAASVACAWGVLCLFQRVTDAGTASRGQMLALLWCYLGLLALSVLGTLLAAFGRDDWDTRLFSSCLTKLLLIPFFLANFAVGGLGSVVMFLTPQVMPAVLLAALTAWMLMLSTSVDIIRALPGLRRAGVVRGGAVHVLCQLFWVADVADAGIIYCRWYRSKPRDRSHRA